MHCSIQCFKSMQKKKTKEGKGCDSATKFEEFNNLCCITCKEKLINSFCSTCKEASQCLECSEGQTCPITENDCNIHSLSFSFGEKENENGHEIGKMRKISWVEGTQEILKDLSPSRSSWMHLVVEKLVNLSSFMTILLPIFNRGANHEEMIKQ